MQLAWIFMNYTLITDNAFTINWIVEDCSGALDTANTAHRASHIPQLNVVGFLFWGPLFVIMNLQMNRQGLH